MEDRYILQGVVERSLFQSEENGYAVIIIRINKHTEVTVTGFLPSIQAGQQITVKGVWTKHPKFGRQFQSESCQVELPTSKTGLARYLGSGMIKGIGKVYAQRLVDYFGQDVLRIIEQEPHRLNEVDGISTKRVEQIKESWIAQKEIAAIMAFLHDKGISSAYAMRIYKAYGQQSLSVLQENPYRLAEEVNGIGFKTADAIAQKMGIDSHAIARVRAGILHTIAQATTSGHLYVPYQQLKKETIEILQLESDRGQTLFDEALSSLRAADKTRAITEPDDEIITLSSYFYSEQKIANLLKKLQQLPSEHQFPIEKIYQSLRAGQFSTITLNEDQQRGILTCLQQKITIITGGPGTGKTTLIKALLSILDEHKKQYKLTAPTGRAAKRINESTGRYALTIHRLLEFDPAARSFTRNEQNALKLDFLIVDEASMIDVFLALALFRALPQHAHIILLGDIDQLPSVGAGNVLGDIIISQTVPCIRLNHIFRQSGDSLIIVNAHRINRGEFPSSFLPNSKKDFFFIKEEDPARAMHHIRTIFSTAIARFGITSQDTVVLTPMNRGIVGTTQLNHELQEFLNSPAENDISLRYASTLFRKGDRVMQLVNNYDKSVFNGDVGIIETVDPEEKQLLIHYGDRPVLYEYHELMELSLAYAMTVHKSQGSEYPAVIVPIFMQHFMLLQRNLVYTALTRAKQLCIIIGQPKALAIAIKNKKTVERRTYLKKMLKGTVTCH